MAAAYRDEWPVLLVVPSGLRNHWVDELRQWLPGAGKHSIPSFLLSFYFEKRMTCQDRLGTDVRKAEQNGLCCGCQRAG